MKRLLFALLLTSAGLAQPGWQVDSPIFPVVRSQDDWLTLEIRGPAGQRPILSCGNRSWILEEVQPGRYQARVWAPQGDFHLEGQALGQIVRTPPEDFGLFQAGPEGAILRTGPSSDFDRLTPLWPGVRLPIVERQGDYLRVDRPWGWVRCDQGVLLDPSLGQGGSRLTGVQVGERPQEIRLRLGQPCGWQVQADPIGRRFCLHLPGASMAMHEMAFRDRAPWLGLLPGPEGVTLEIPLTHKFWGYQLEWRDPELWLRLTPPPRIDPEHPFKGLVITLDAGHGGADLGTVGLELKVKEKDLNLTLARALQRRLEKAGARVVMTRTLDRELTAEDASASEELQARVEVAERSGSHLFVSIHHNARAQVAQGRVSHGTHIYYYQPQSHDLARAVAEPLARAIGEKEWLHLWRSFHVTRQTRIPSVLVEANFLSNPNLERGMLSQPDYPEKAAAGIQKGLEAFLRQP